MVEQTQLRRVFLHSQRSGINIYPAYICTKYILYFEVHNKRYVHFQASEGHVIVVAIVPVRSLHTDTFTYSYPK